MPLKRNNYEALPAAVGPYVHAVAHGDTLYLSGLIALGTPAQTGGIEEQTREILRQIEVVAEAEGVTLQNLIKVTMFVTNMKELGNLRQTLFDIYGVHLPASSLVEVQQLIHPDLKIEIEAVLALR